MRRRTVKQKRRRPTTASDPLERTQADAGEDLARRTVRFSIGWVPVSKKNQTKARRREDKARDRVYYQAAPTKLAKAQEEAIALLARAELAFARGRIDHARRRFFRDVAATRAAEELGAAEFRSLANSLRRELAFERDEMVRFELVEHVGKNAGEDWVDVTVSFLDRPDREARRTGQGHDLINIPAIVADAIQGELLADDAQIVSLVVDRVLD